MLGKDGIRPRFINLLWTSFRIFRPTLITAAFKLGALICILLITTVQGVRAWSVPMQLAQYPFLRHSTWPSGRGRSPDLVRGPSDPAELEAFLDDLVSSQLADHDIPGAVVSVVKDGELFFAKGYGYADMARGRAMDPDETLVLIGSITKLFTFTAVMQLVEQDKLALDVDINAYLQDFQIPPTYPEPVTLHHLLTHTAGFEDRLSHMFRLREHPRISRAAYLERQMSKRVYPPGELIGYSNYGVALAGYLVAQISGMPTDTYIEKYILEPLKMDHTTIRQVASPKLEDNFARGFFPGLSGELVSLKEPIPAAPITTMRTTATDIAKFMIAHLQDGRYQDVRILGADTAQMMHQQHFTHDPRIPGVTYGFVEWVRNDQHILWHAGKTALFYNLCMLLPEHDVGVFISYNRARASDARAEFRQAFLDHYYPVTLSEPRPMEGYAERVKRFAGTYQESRWAYTTSDVWVYALVRTHIVTANPDGTLQYLRAKYVEVEPFVFREVNGQGILIFREADFSPHKGRLIALCDFDPHEVLIKMRWYETPIFHLILLALCITVFLSVLVGASPQRWGRGGHLSVAKWVSGFNLIFLIGMLLVGLSVALDPYLNLAFLAPIFVILLVLVLIVSIILVVSAWTKPARWRMGGQVHATLLMLASLIFMGWLYYWNLLGLWQF